MTRLLVVMVFLAAVFAVACKAAEAPPATPTSPTPENGIVHIPPGEIMRPIDVPPPAPVVTPAPTAEPTIAPTSAPTPTAAPTPAPTAEPKSYSVLKGSWQGGGSVVAVFFPEDILLMVEGRDGSYLPCLKDAQGGTTRFYQVLNRRPEGVFMADDGTIATKTTDLSPDRISGTIQITSRGCISAEMRWQTTFFGVGEGAIREAVTYSPALQTMLRDIARIRH